jgi:hypothetical protein
MSRMTPSRGGRVAALRWRAPNRYRDGHLGVAATGGCDTSGGGDTADVSSMTVHSLY